jgi:hypothetical protein
VPLPNKATAKKGNWCHLCDKRVLRILRHLTITHGLEGTKLQEARTASRAALLASHRAVSGVSGLGTNKNPAHLCPIQGCAMVVQRFDRHLASVHSITKAASPEEYTRLLKSATTW